MIQLELFEGIRFFETFSSDQLQTIYPLTERRFYPAGETILSQGAVNFELLFLLQGQVDISIDGQLVVSIVKQGEVFGEMSIANHTTCTATVTARTDCTMLVLNFQELKQNLPLDQKDSVLKNFYQSCAEILARKLVLTNQLAKSYRAEHGD